MNQRLLELVKQAQENGEGCPNLTVEAMSS
jgi:hypothetical protein